jgi:hypothetical protein
VTYCYLLDRSDDGLPERLGSGWTAGLLTQRVTLRGAGIEYRFLLVVHLPASYDMSGEEELAFLKAHLGELSPAVVRQLKPDIVAEKKKREAEAAAKAKGSGERLTGQPSGRQPGSAGGETSVSEKDPEPQRASVKPTSWTRPTRAVTWNLPLGARRPAPGPLSGVVSAPLPAQAKGSYAQGPVVLPTASTGEQAAFSGRQISYAEVGAAYAGVLAGRPVKGATAGVESSAPLPTNKEASQEGKGGRDEKASRGTPPVSKPSRGKKDVTVGTNAGGRLGDHPVASKEPSGTLKSTTKGTSSAPIPAASTEAASRRTSPGAPGDLSGPLSVTPIGTTPTTAQVDKVVPPGERRNKTPVYVSGVKSTRKFLDWIRARSESRLVAQMKGGILKLVP